MKKLTIRANVIISKMSTVFVFVFISSNIILKPDYDYGFSVCCKHHLCITIFSLHLTVASGLIANEKIQCYVVPA
jgi:hypothetical protein